MYLFRKKLKVAHSCLTLCDPMDWLCSPWNSLGQNTGVGSLSLLQGIFPTQGSNPGLPHCRWIHYQLSHKGSPRILEWVAYPFSSGSSWPRNWTGVSCIAGGFFTNWVIREAHICIHILYIYMYLVCILGIRDTYIHIHPLVFRKMKTTQKQMSWMKQLSFLFDYINLMCFISTTL